MSDLKAASWVTGDIKKIANQLAKMDPTDEMIKIILGLNKIHYINSQIGVDRFIEGSHKAVSIFSSDNGLNIFEEAKKINKDKLVYKNGLMPKEINESELIKLSVSHIFYSIWYASEPKHKFYMTSKKYKDDQISIAKKSFNKAFEALRSIDLDTPWKVILDGGVDHESLIDAMNEILEQYHPNRPTPTQEQLINYIKANDAGLNNLEGEIRKIELFLNTMAIASLEKNIMKLLDFIDNQNVYMAQPGSKHKAESKLFHKSILWYNQYKFNEPNHKLAALITSHIFQITFTEDNSRAYLSNNPHALKPH